MCVRVYIYTHMRVYACVCMCVCVCVTISVGLYTPSRVHWPTDQSSQLQGEDRQARAQQTNVLREAAESEIKLNE